MLCLAPTFKAIFLSLAFVLLVYGEKVNYYLTVRSISSAPEGFPSRVLTIREGETWNPDAPFPGPTIRAKFGDTLQINALEDQTTFIHFHGLHTINNAWMAGVHMIFLTIPTSFIPRKDEHKPDITTIAILKYTTSQDVVLDLINSSLLSIDDVVFEYGLKPKKNQVALPAVRRITLFYEVLYNNTDGDQLEEWAINKNTFTMPTEPLLQATFLDGSDSSVIVNRTGRVGNFETTYKEVLEFGEVYEVRLVSSDAQQHPWHIHGCTVNFTAVGVMDNSQLPYYIDECGYNISNYRSYNFDSVLPDSTKSVDVIAIGDSFTVPASGYVAFRFKADNAGPWLFHCHMEWHLATGLAMVFSVEKSGTYQNLISPPPSNFPVCGSKNQWPTVPSNSPSSPNQVSSAYFVAVSFDFFVLILAFWL